MPAGLNKRVENGKKTAARLIKTARGVFSAEGYARASTEKVVGLAGVTRGALYHHFSGKKDLFHAVFENALADVEQRIVNVFSQEGPTWERFLAANYEFLKVCRDPEIQQIVFVDAPSVLGWDTWIQVDGKYTTRLLKEILTWMIKKRIIRPFPIDALAHSISGAANESALWIAQSEEPEKALQEAKDTMEALLNSLLIEDDGLEKSR